LSRNLELLGVLQQRLTDMGVHAEVHDYLLTLVVFRDTRLPVCVFIGGNGQFYSWDSGRGRVHIADVERAAAQLAELAGSPVETELLRSRSLPMKGSDHEDT